MRSLSCREVALLVANDGFLNGQHERLVALTNGYAIPAAFGNREFVEAGVLRVMVHLRRVHHPSGHLCRTHPMG